MVKVKYREISPELDKLASPTDTKNSRVSIGFENEVGEYYYFSVEDLIPYKNQARTIFDQEEINKLSETIKEHGIRQPLTIIKSRLDSSKYEVVSGERRLRAAKLAGLSKVPCIIIKDEVQADEISLLENIQRQDLHPLELAYAINTLIEGKPYGAKAEIGRKIGLSKSQISELLSLLSLPKEVQDKLLKESVRGREHFRKLLAIESINDQLTYIEQLNEKLKEEDALGSKKKISRSIIRLSMVEGVLKVQSYSLNKISFREREDVKKALLSLIEQLEEKSVRGREHLNS